MPVSDRAQIVNLEDHSEERLGRLWRSQGEDFLAEAASELTADVERLRGAYIKRLDAVEPPPIRPAPAKQAKPAKGRRRQALPAATIDLRGEDVTGVACARHGIHTAVSRCSRCHDAFCSLCIVPPAATGSDPLCTWCALRLSGVSHRPRPLVAPGRMG